MEVEAKILEVDVKDTIDRLETLGAQKAYEGPITDEIYEKDGFDGYYRIRLTDEHVIVTLKTKIKQDGVKTADEREKEADDAAAARQDAEALGFSYSFTKRKKRTKYLLGEAVFDLDEYEDIPPLLEIEAPSRLQIEAWAEKLGHQKNELKDWGYDKLMTHYGRRPGRADESRSD